MPLLAALATAAYLLLSMTIPLTRRLTDRDEQTPKPHPAGKAKDDGDEEDYPDDD